ncbi:hypothetical protein [Nocardia africana]
MPDQTPEISPEARQKALDIETANNTPHADLALRHAQALSVVRILWASRSRWIDEMVSQLGSAYVTLAAAEVAVEELEKERNEARARSAELEAEKDLLESYDQWLKHEFGVDEGAYARFLEEEANSHG